MLDYISYLLCFVLLLSIIIYVYIRIKYDHKYTQYMYCKYNLNTPYGLINDAMPQKTKYINCKDIDTLSFSQLTSYQISKWIHLLTKYYNHHPNNTFIPKPCNLTSYFIGHNSHTYISFYYQDTYLLEIKTNNLITERTIVGSLTSKPMTITIFKDKNPTPFRAYYMDYMCVKDKLDIDTQLFHTHYYNQRHLNPSVNVSIFKREKAMNGIVPLCVYSTYQFPVNTWTKPNELSAEYKILDINGTNYRVLYEFISEQKHLFDITIESDMTNILELIKSNNIFITVIMCDEHILACYCFRKSCIFIDKDLEMLTCFASICNCEESIFIQGFKISFWKIAAEYFFGHAAIEDTSHNHLCIQNIIQKTQPSFIQQTNYYFYNFAYPTFKPNRILLFH